MKSHSRPLYQNILLFHLNLSSMTDIAPSRKSVNWTTVDPVLPKRKEKVIEAAEPTDRRPTLSDSHISHAEDSHPNTTSPFKMQPSEPEPLLNGDQLFQMLSSMQKQMENQQTKMIRSRDVVAREKEAATCVQIRLLKQIRVQRGSRSSPTARRNP